MQATMTTLWPFPRPMRHRTVSISHSLAASQLEANGMTIADILGTVKCGFHELLWLHSGFHISCQYAFRWSLGAEIISSTLLGSKFKCCNDEQWDQLYLWFFWHIWWDRFFLCMQIPWLRSSYGYFPNLSCLWNIFVDFKSSTRIIGFILRDTTKSFFLCGIRSCCDRRNCNGSSVNKLILFGEHGRIGRTDWTDPGRTTGEPVAGENLSRWRNVKWEALWRIVSFVIEMGLTRSGTGTGLRNFLA